MKLLVFIISLWTSPPLFHHHAIGEDWQISIKDVSFLLDQHLCTVRIEINRIALADLGFSPSVVDKGHIQKLNLLQLAKASPEVKLGGKPDSMMDNHGKNVRL